MTGSAQLTASLAEFARKGSVLIICDYDGTLAPLVDDPDLAFPERRSVEALQALAELTSTHVAVLSGRSLRDLSALYSFPTEIHRVGSHGSEYTTGLVDDLNDAQLRLLDRIGQSLRQVAELDDGFIVETKPASVAFHYRKAAPEIAVVAIEEIKCGPARWPGVRVKEGKKVIELAVVDANKGLAVERLRRQVDADAVLFIGDDVTDEDAFGVLRSPDIGIKVGDGATLARHRLTGTNETASILALLLELRRSWIAGDRSS